MSNRKVSRPRPLVVVLDTDIPHIGTMSSDAAAILSAASLAATYLDLSFELGVPVGTVKSRLHRARQKLAALREAEAKLEAAI